MKRVMTVLLAAMMLFGGLHLVTAEEIIDTVISEESLADETIAEEKATEEAAEAAAETAVSAEEPAVDELADVELMTKTAAEPTEKVNDEAEADPVWEEEIDTEEGLEAALRVFSGTLIVRLNNEGTIHNGDQVIMTAIVGSANLEYAILWQRILKDDLTPNIGEDGIWRDISNKQTYSFEADEYADEYYYRAVLTAVDGTEIISGNISFQVEPAAEKIEDEVLELSIDESKEELEDGADEAPENENSAEVITEEETAEEVISAGETATEEIAEEVISAEETATEENVEEVISAGETATEEIAEEVISAGEIATEEIAEEVISAEETAKEEAVEDVISTEENAAEEIAEELISAEETAKEEAVEEAISTKETVAGEIAEEAANDIDDYETALAIEQHATLYTTDDADVRLEANGLSAIFATMDKGTAVTAIGQVGNWTRIVIGDQVGFIYSDSLTAALPEDDEHGEVIPAAKEKDEVGKIVTIFSSRRTVMTEGEYVLLSSKIEGFEGLDIIYQWECDQGDGFKNVENANSDTYVFRASAESLSWDWRLTIYYR